MLLQEFADARHLAVERAIGELRAARPVLIHHDGGRLVCFSVEGLDDGTLRQLEEAQSARLIVPAAKAGAAIAQTSKAASVCLSPFTLQAILDFMRPSAPSQKAKPAGIAVDVKPAARAEVAALALANLSFLLPAVAVFPLSAADADPGGVLAVEAEAVLSFRDAEAKNLKIISRSFVPLDGVKDSEFIIFRGGDGFRDQVAVIVSRPSPGEPVLVRIHSACLTGDLFGSLKCDCGDQLRGTVRVMSEKGGGIVLYLDQEGRGNGIANKIRAYGLQAHGLDTYDADAALGFGQDQRRFDFAARMLTLLGYTRIKLMTNNPAKIEALRLAGLDVVSTERVIGKANSHNAQYLAAKRDKAGHLLQDAAIEEICAGDLIASKTSLV